MGTPIELTHPFSQIAVTHMENGQRGFKELDYEIVDDHYVLYLTERPSRLSVISDGHLLHDGPVFPGMMRLASPGEHVRVGVFSHTETITVAVPGRIMRDSVRILGNNHPFKLDRRLAVLSQPNPQVAQLGRMVRSHKGFGPAHEALFLGGITRTLLAYLLRNHGRPLRMPPPPTGLTPQEIQSAMDYADANIAGVVTLDDWATALGMPTNEFRRRFHVTLGQAPYAWYMQRRVDRAKDLLAQPDKPLCQIALDVGFSSQSHFTEAFRRREGLPPARWREERQS